MTTKDESGRPAGATEAASGAPSPARPAARSGVMAPLRQPVFRRIWVSSLFSNLGQQVQAVAAAWTMTQLTSAPEYVALVQTASMLPIMLIALPGGAIADIYDRRLAALYAAMIALVGAFGLFLAAVSGMLTPMVLLAGCFVVGSGIALFAPAWQSSVVEQVGHESMPAAVALYAMSTNAARSVGPAVGGLIVASAGTIAAFGLNVALYVPIIVSLWLWRRQVEPPRLPPEGIMRAIKSGVRYVSYAPTIRRVMLRCMVTAVGGSAVYALLPLVARFVLEGNAQTYGLLLGSFGVGAVGAGPMVDMARRRYDPERVVCLCSLVMGGAVIVTALSPFTALTCLALLLNGACWMVTISTYNITVQASAPRWVAGRALAVFQASICAGLAFGSWAWGNAAEAWGVQTALFLGGCWLTLSPLLAILARISRTTGLDNSLVPSRSELDVRLDLTGRSGPVVVEAEHRVPRESAREFYHIMQQIRRHQERKGAYGVSLSRDVNDPELWVERLHYPTWHDFLRARERVTQAERDLHDLIQPIRKELTFRRLLERPFGSVRWKDQTQAPPPFHDPGPVEG